MSSNDKHSILVIGATGKTGLEIIRQLDGHASKPAIHVLCRDTIKLSKATNYASVTRGNARNAQDIRKALERSKADWVVISVGNGEDVSKNDIRTANAEATVSVLEKPEFAGVRPMVVSSTGAGSSKIIVGFGIGKLITFHLRHVLADHTGQEAAFQALESLRCIVVRATALTDDAPTGRLVQFGDNDKSPTIKTDRADLACWIVNEMCGQPTMPNGGIVNVTGVTK